MACKESQLHTCTNKQVFFAPWRCLTKPKATHEKTEGLATQYCTYQEFLGARTVFQVSFINTGFTGAG